MSQLTEMEQAIAVRIATTGASAKTIAHELGLTPVAINVCVREAVHRLGFWGGSNRVRLAMWHIATCSEAERTAILDRVRQQTRCPHV